jgi:hypothetical protein
MLRQKRCYPTAPLHAEPSLHGDINEKVWHVARAKLIAEFESEHPNGGYAVWDAEWIEIILSTDQLDERMDESVGFDYTIYETLSQVYEALHSGQVAWNNLAVLHLPDSQAYIQMIEHDIWDLYRRIGDFC